MAVTNVVTNFSFTGSLDRLKAFNTGMTKAISHVTKFAIAVKGIESATRVFTTLTMGSLQPLVDLSRVTGVATERIQALEYAAIKAGGSGAEFKNSLNSIQSKISEASVSGSSDFAMLGISIRDANGQLKSADKVMFEVGRRLNSMNLSQAQQINFASRMGIDANTLKLITKSNDEVNRLTKEAGQLGLVTSNQAKKISSFNASIASLKFSLTAIQNQVAIGLSPKLKELSGRFQDLIKNNKEWVTDAIKGSIKVLESLGRGVTRVAGFIWDLSVALTGSKQGAIALLAVIGLWLSPISLVTAGIAAALLVLEDLIVAFNGGNSLIRKFFLDILGFDITPHLKLIVSAFKDVFDMIRNLFAALWHFLTGDWGAMVESLKKAFKPLVDWFENFLFKPIKNAFDWVKKKLKDLIPDWMKWVLGKMGFNISVDSDNFDESKANSEALIAQQALTPNTTYNSSASSSSQVLNNHVEINVTGNDPQQTGAIVKDRITDELANANAQARAIGGK